MAAQQCLSSFFSAPNVFGSPLSNGWSTSTPQVPAAIRPSILRLAKEVKDRPILLPFALAGESETCWFACAHDELSGRVLRDEMMAFVGPSFGEFEGDGFTLSADQSSAKALLSHAGLHVVAFCTRKPTYAERVARGWHRYWQLLEQRPPRPRQDLRTFGQLRAAFDRALVARNEKDALAAIAALRDQHGLSAENRAFLDIRLSAAFGRWSNILEHPQWEDLLKVRLPPETYGDVWDALYETYLAEAEASGSAQALINAFENDVRVPAAPLLKSRGRSRRPAALKGFLLYELSVEAPSAELCADLLKQLDPNAFGAASEDLKARVASMQRKSGLAQALIEMDLERYEQAIALLVPLADSVAVLQAQLRCAKEIAEPATASAALDRLAATPEEIAAPVRASRTRLIADLEKIADHAVPAALTDQLAECTTPASVEDVVTYWRELVRSPGAASKLVDPEFVGSLVSTIEDSAVDETPLFESLLPIWFDWLVVRTPPSSACARVYRAFIVAIQVRNRLGDSDREMVRLAVRHALLGGLTPSEYTEMVDGLNGLLPDSLSTREIAWTLDIADLLITEPCRDEEARMRWIAKAVAYASQGWSRLSAPERFLAKALAQESQIEMHVPSEHAEADLMVDSSAVHAKICLYSLDTLAISRAARVLADALPHAKIDINSDDTCTPRLRAGAKNADWFVFVSAVASHQAFYCIKNSLRPDAELLQVEGSGTTRIVERVIRHAQISPVSISA